MFVKDVKGFQAALFDRISLLSLRFEQNQNFIENFFTKEKFFQYRLKTTNLRWIESRLRLKVSSKKIELWLL